MKKAVLLVVACFWLAVLVLGVGCSPVSQEQYNYYIQIANQYTVAAVSEQNQADYFISLAQQLAAQGMASQEEVNNLLALANQHRETSVKYLEQAQEYRDKAAGKTK